MLSRSGVEKCKSGDGEFLCMTLCLLIYRCYWLAQVDLPQSGRVTSGPTLKEIPSVLRGGRASYFRSGEFP